MPPTAETVPSALQHFDALPDSAHVRLPVVEALYSCSGATIWRGVKRGTIPAPHKLSTRVSAWNVGELRRAMACAQ
jgi:predicted DNA-binding transcriptional regulator AlpA